MSRRRSPDPRGTARPAVRAGALAAACAALLLGSGSSAAAAPLPGETPCPGSTTVRCATVTVPLDRSGAMPGTIGLAARRLPATGAASPSAAIVGLAGGPGQATTPLVADFADALSPGLGDHDLLVFDPRGTGSSGALHCGALSAPRTTLGTSGECARQIGARRAHYTTEDAVQDLEAVRQAGGYDKLTLFAVSYGTKVALRYAARHPEHVERLILDSVLTPDGPDPFTLSSFAAMRRVLPDICAGRSCAGITGAPTRDLAALRRRLSRSALRTTLVSGHGRRRAVRVTVLDLLSVVRAGDFNPTLRADLPAAVRAALHHDGAPLARLAGRAGGIAGSTAGMGQQDTGGVDDALFLATTCEEAPFPWGRAAAPLTRLREAEDRASALSPSAVAPFDRPSALFGGLVPLCLTWPDASAAPPPTGPLPNVPTLVLDGAADVRTPVEDARAVAAQIPSARLVVIPRTGHSVLGSDLSGCARAALGTFLSGGAVADCGATPDRFPPTRVPPLSIARLGRASGVPGAAGRTLRAVRLTLSDAANALLSHAISDSAIPRAGVAIGGLRGGSLLVTAAGVRLRAYSLIPGVTLTGLVGSRAGSGARLRVGGRAAARGTITLRPGGSVRGSLGGRRIHVVRSAGARLAAGGLLPAAPFRLPRLAAIR